jgi:hypothetical protein
MPYVPLVPMSVKIAVVVGIVLALGYWAIRCPQVRWVCFGIGAALAFWAGAQAGKIREWNKHKSPPEG